MKTIAKYNSLNKTLIIRENSKGEYIGELYEKNNVKRGQWIGRATFEGKDATEYRVMEYFNFDQEKPQQQPTGTTIQIAHKVGDTIIWEKYGEDHKGTVTDIDLFISTSNGEHYQHAVYRTTESETGERWYVNEEDVIE